MADNDRPTGYKQPPIKNQFQKGQSGNPRGRPKKVPDFLEDAVTIFGAPVNGQANGKEITLSMLQAMFRRLCRDALKGDNAALRRVIDLMLTLEPKAEQQDTTITNEILEASRKFDRLIAFDPDAIDEDPKVSDP